MKKLIVVVALIAVAVVAMKKLGGGKGAAKVRQQEAEQRVAKMFNLLGEISRTPSTQKEQQALCWYYEGQPACTSVTGDASIAFDDWRRQKDAYEIRSFTLRGSTPMPRGDKTGFVVDCLINGKEIGVVAFENERLSWKK